MPSICKTQVKDIYIYISLYIGNTCQRCQGMWRQYAWKCSCAIKDGTPMPGSHGNIGTFDFYMLLLIIHICLFNTVCLEVKAKNNNLKNYTPQVLKRHVRHAPNSIPTQTLHTIARHLILHSGYTHNLFAPRCPCRVVSPRPPLLGRGAGPCCAFPSGHSRSPLVLSPRVVSPSGGMVCCALICVVWCCVYGLWCFFGLGWKLPVCKLEVGLLKFYEGCLRWKFPNLA